MKIGDIELEDDIRSQTNTLVLGSIGYGKSRFVEYLIRQDLRARQPFCLISMHSALYHAVNAWCAFNDYDDRRIILVDPSEGAFAKGFNPFRRRQGLQTSVQTSGMVEAVLSVWGNENPNTTPVMFKLMKVLFTVVVELGIPLHEAFELFTRRDAFTDKVDQLQDDIIRALWNDLAKMSPAEWTRHVTPTLNRIFRIVQSDTIRRFMCVQKEGYNLDLTFEDTILVNLGTSGNLDADSAKTFAALLLNDLYQSAKRRKGRDGKDPAPYYVYVDEWWLVPSPDFHRILAETRKFGLLLALANQDLSQIKSSFSSGFGETILTLCQQQFCFGGINVNDASRLAREWGITTEQLQHLLPRQCFAKLPRQPARIIDVPEVREPFMDEERLASFERRIAKRTGGLPLGEVDRILRESRKQRSSTACKEVSEEDLIYHD